MRHYRITVISRDVRVVIVTYWSYRHSTKRISLVLETNRYLINGHLSLSTILRVVFLYLDFLLSLPFFLSPTRSLFFFLSTFVTLSPSHTIFYCVRRCIFSRERNLPFRCCRLLDNDIRSNYNFPNTDTCDRIFCIYQLTDTIIINRSCTNE